MFNKIYSSIIAGVISGIFLIIISIIFINAQISLVDGLPSFNYTQNNIISIIFIIIFILTYFFTGPLTIVIGKQFIIVKKDTIIFASLAGLICSIVQILLVIIYYLYYLNISNFSPAQTELSTILLIWFVGIVLGSIISAIGAWVFIKLVH